jgi:2-dehydro-3-deoxyphosphogluconate aldolase/(4S)-4-hydroxy-2-oxoglutarate aldolase
LPGQATSFLSLKPKNPCEEFLNMTKGEVCDRIRNFGIIPAIRVPSHEDARFAVEALIGGGIPIAEISVTIPSAPELISHLARNHPDVVFGGGTVLDISDARRCKEAGASFITAPGFDPEIVRFAARENIASLPGGLTPTEVVMAWKAGADFVKLFPCAQVGGEHYIKKLKNALPQISLIAAGGVNQNTAADLIAAGADAIGVGTELIPTDAVLLRKADRIHELAIRFTGFVRDGRTRFQV